MLGHIQETGDVCTPRDRVFGVLLFGLGLKLIERFTEHHAVIG